MRTPRIDFPGARHHVMNRGARRQAVFVDDDTRNLFLQTLAELPARFGVRVHGYALMPNHYHLMLESVRGELSRAMRHLGGEFSRRLNVASGWDGPVFRGRFRNRIVGTDVYWRHLLLYVHLNPVRAGLTDIDTAAWTSHRAYVERDKCPAWLTVDEQLALFGGPATYSEALCAAYEGNVKPPAGFDPKKLWAPESTGAVAMPKIDGPRTNLAESFAALCAITGLAPNELTATRYGRKGNPAKWFAAWWLSRQCGVPHGAIGAILGASHTVISQRVARVEAQWRQDPTMRVWVADLRGLPVR
jgi:REP element-mobilizing transposase RayT